jgi:FkbM family methyltransferase
MMIAEERGVAAPGRDIDSELPFLDEDIFRGYFPEDVERLTGMMPAPAAPAEGVMVDALGVRVRPDYCPWIQPKVGTVLSGIPLPNDGYFAPGIEYACLALAIQFAGRPGAFSLAEIGAGWGPWLTAGAALARANGRQELRLIGVEASAIRFEAMRQHLALNRLVSHSAPLAASEGAVTWRLERCAVDACDGTLYWPLTENVHDAGMAASAISGAQKDYRGVAQQMVPVKALSLATLLDDTPELDMLHVDIQGSEFEVIKRSRDVLDRKVRTMFIGTHSRKIEGDFVDLFFGSNWWLLREKPCQFYSMASAPQLTGLSYHDGGQFYVNTDLVALARP